jgi:hypothetical protein
MKLALFRMPRVDQSVTQSFEEANVSVKAKAKAKAKITLRPEVYGHQRIFFQLSP